MKQIARHSDLCVSQSRQREQPHSLSLGRPSAVRRRAGNGYLPAASICNQMRNRARGTWISFSYGGKEGFHLVLRFSMCLRI